MKEGGKKERRMNEGKKEGGRKEGKEKKKHAEAL